MTEAYDYDPSGWKGHDFTAARAAYNRHVGSSYTDATAKGVKADELIAKELTSNAQRPLIVVVDQTGSMGEWPATMFSKLPYLAHEASWYLGDDTEIAFMAIGDAQSYHPEEYPLQVQDFASGQDLKKKLKKLVIEGKGGGGISETYELAALYLLENLKVDPAAEPVIIFIGDEECYNSVSVEDAEKWSKVTLEHSVTTSHIFKQLRKKASVYFIHKPYGYGSSGDDDETTKSVRRHWAKLVGGDHIASLGDPNRVVDVIFGILASEVGRFDDFVEEIEGRQTPSQRKTVYKSLATIHVLPSSREALPSGKSRMFNASDADDASPLLGD